MSCQTAHALWCELLGAVWAYMLATRCLLSQVISKPTARLRLDFRYLQKERGEHTAFSSHPCQKLSGGVSKVNCSEIHPLQLWPPGSPFLKICFNYFNFFVKLSDKFLNCFSEFSWSWVSSKKPFWILGLQGLSALSNEDQALASCWFHLVRSWFPVSS